MKFRLAWACGGIVALAALVKLTVGSNATEAGQGPKSASVPSARPTPGTLDPSGGGSPSPPSTLLDFSSKTRKRLQDDTLPPPPQDAPAMEREEYQRALRQIRGGKDPFVGGETDPRKMKEAVMERLRARQLAAQKRIDDLKAAHRVVGEQKNQEMRERLIRAGLDPDKPPPELFPPPVVTPETEPEAPKQP